MSETPKTDKLKADVAIERYGRPVAAALHLCLELERRNTAMRDVLREVAEYLDPRAGADYFNDYPSPVPNEAMRLLVAIKDVLGRV